MNIKCKKCGLVYDLGPEYGGKKVQCQCGAEMIVPEIKTPSSLNVKFKNDGRSYPPRASEKSVSKTVDGNADVFTVPKIAKWTYEIGKVVVALGIVFTIFGIIGVCADGAKNFPVLVTILVGTIFGVLLMGFGKALDYLAEIAFNTRKK